MASVRRRRVWLARCAFLLLAASFATPALAAPGTLGLTTIPAEFSDDTTPSFGGDSDPSAGDVTVTIRPDGGGSPMTLTATPDSTGGWSVSMAAPGLAVGVYRASASQGGATDSMAFPFTVEPPIAEPTPTAEPTATPTETPTATPPSTPAPIETPTATPTETPTPAPTEDPLETPTPTPTSTAEPVETPTPTITPTPTEEPIETPTPTPTGTPTVDPQPSAAPIVTPTRTPTPTATPPTSRSQDRGSSPPPAAQRDPERPPESPPNGSPPSTESPPSFVSPPSAPAPPTTSPRARRIFIRPFPTIRIAGTLTRSGARLRVLSVTAPAGSRIVVRCLSGTCRGQVVRRRVRRPGIVRIGVFQRALRAGTTITVTVSAPNKIGKHVRFTVRRGAAPARTDRCLATDGVRAIACPTP